MKKIFSILVVSAFATLANAQTIYPVGDDKNVMEMGISMDEESKDVTAIPVYVNLKDESAITDAIELYLQLPDGAVWSYDEDEEDYVYEKSSRCVKNHAPVVAMSEDSNRPNQLYISVASSKLTNFKETEGAILTIYFDGSKLTDGQQYEIKVIDPAAFDESDTYLCEGSTYAFTYANGTVTGINTISADAQAAKYYSVNGAIQNGPQKGVNIVKYANGEVKKVIVK